MGTSLQEALDSRTDLDVYKDNKRLLFALQISFMIDHIHTVASQALTDGVNDKKCDLVYVDPSSSRAVIAQAYEAVMPRPVGKANRLIAIEGVDVGGIRPFPGGIGRGSWSGCGSRGRSHVGVPAGR